MKTKEEILKEEIQWCKEIIAREEKNTLVREIPEEFQMYRGIRSYELKEHIERLESDLEDLRENRVATGGFDLEGEDDE